MRGGCIWIHRYCRQSIESACIVAHGHCKAQDEGFHPGFLTGVGDISICIAIRGLEHTSVDFINILNSLKKNLYEILIEIHI